MKLFSRKFKLKFVSASSFVVCAALNCVAVAQDTLPRDNGIYTYYTAPEWRESEAHPLRIAAYVLHPIGWALREGITRPLSYFASSTEVRRSVMGYRYPFDFRNPECFSSDDNLPDCRTVMPFNYQVSDDVDRATEIYFPNVNFDFDKRSLNPKGVEMVSKIASTLKKESNVKVVLQGHTDYIGSNAYNEVLGLDRANAVRDELVRLGVTIDRLSTVSFGETVPLVNDKGNDARAANRRVETILDDR
jgi:outer membrane protein OmpA-like peptidoglycan-associated protein